MPKAFCSNCGEEVETSDPFNTGMETYHCGKCGALGTLTRNQPTLTLFLHKVARLAEVFTAQRLEERHTYLMTKNGEKRRRTCDEFESLASSFGLEL